MRRASHRRSHVRFEGNAHVITTQRPRAGIRWPAIRPRSRPGFRRLGPNRPALCAPRAGEARSALIRQVTLAGPKGLSSPVPAGTRRIRSRRTLDKAGRGHVQIRRHRRVSQVPDPSRASQRPTRSSSSSSGRAWAGLLDSLEPARLLTRIGDNEGSRRRANGRALAGGRCPPSALRHDRQSFQDGGRRLARRLMQLVQQHHGDHVQAGHEVCQAVDVGRDELVRGPRFQLG